MKQMIEFIKTTMLGGALVIIPAALVVFLPAKVARGLKGARGPAGGSDTFSSAMCSIGCRDTRWSRA
jgi:hypothetical protein